MSVRALCRAPSPRLARALARFEEGFLYPIAGGRRFRIDHGDDYPRFFRSLGDAACFVFERDGAVLGTIGAAVRTFVTPQGTRPIAYLGDLKVAPSAGSGFVLRALLRTAAAWAGRRTSAAYAVVMHGTAVEPAVYTGRAGIPAFERLADLSILRVSTAESQPTSSRAPSTAPDPDGVACFRELNRDRYGTSGGRPEDRSERAPVWLVDPQREACGRLEDTLRAKRLVVENGSELRAAHLACFAYRGIDAAAGLVAAACRLARERGFAALWLSVPAAERGPLIRGFAGSVQLAASATVYGCGLSDRPAWSISTSEI